MTLTPRNRWRSKKKLGLGKGTKSQTRIGGAGLLPKILWLGKTHNYSGDRGKDTARPKRKKGGRAKGQWCPIEGLKKKRFEFY